MNSNCIFIDLEWEQRGKSSSKRDSILEIGAVRMNTDLGFIKYIKNDDINWRTRRFLDINQQNVEEGVDIAQAITELVEYSEKANTVIVWSSSTKDKLSILSDKYPCVSLYTKVIVLQELIQTLSGAKDSLSFERALAAFDVDYEARHMHNALFDAMYLRDLFVKIIDKYIEINPGVEDGVIVKKNSEKFHLIGCTYIKNTKEDEKSSVVEAINRKPCRRCCKRLNPPNVSIERKKAVKRHKTVRSYKNKPVTTEAMYEIANYFRLNITGGLNVATISTGYSLWRVYCNKDGYVERLCHENYNSRETGGKGYHNHKQFPRDVFSVFRYIKMHDEAVDITPIADSLIKNQKKKDKKKKMQKERRRIVRMEQDDILEEWTD